MTFHTFCKSFFLIIMLCLTFLLCQILALALVAFAGQLADMSESGLRVAIGSLLGGGFMLFFMSVRNWISWSHAFAKPDISVPHFCVVIAGASSVVIGLNLFAEMVPLPDNNAEQMISLLQQPLGILAVALVSPLVEELLFREAMIGGLLRMDVRPWPAVLVSSVVFGAIHANPAQIPFAIIMGLVFGFIYLRTKSVVLTFLLHVVNNSLAVFFQARYGEEVVLSDLLGPFLPAWIVASILCVLGFIMVRRSLR